jgi:hypothetical protein
MRRFASRFAGRAALAALVGASVSGAGLVGGCANPALRASGPDIAFLSDPDDKRDAAASDLFPLTKGNVWRMQIAARGPANPTLPAPAPVAETIQVVGPSRVGARDGVLVLLSHQGKPWRSEVLRQSATGLEILAFGEGVGPRLELDPPMLLVPARASSGSSKAWRGLVRLKGETFPATGFSRVSGVEALQTRAGRATAFRVDTILTMKRAEQSIHFPAIRWLAPGVGPVRRGFAEQGEAQVSELVGYTVR